jgi:hypothetical protein
MIDGSASFLVAEGSAAAGLALASCAALRGWRQWLALRREQLLAPSPERCAESVELRTLRERVRRLEAIADGG